MNYYPSNLYSNYPYQNTNVYNNQMQPSQQQSYQQIQLPQQAQSVGLNGKIVDSLDMVKVSDIPFGGYGFFPKGDLSEIYMKTWNTNGTTSIKTYRPLEDKENGIEDIPDNKILLEKIIQLENKIDSIVTMERNESISNSSNAKKSSQETSNRKETKADAY